MTADPRVTRLRAAARAKSETKTRAAEAAIRELAKTGTPISFRAIANKAGVSHLFLYANPDLRSRINHLRSHQRPATAPAPQPSSETTLVQTLSIKIDQLKREHRTQLAEYRSALEQAHGENLALRRLLTDHGILLRTQP